MKLGYIGRISVFSVALVLPPGRSYTYWRLVSPRLFSSGEKGTLETSIMWERGLVGTASG